MREDLRRRLRELGMAKGVRELAASPASIPRQDSDSVPRSTAIEDLVSGRFHTTSHGRCFVAEELYRLDYIHGDLPLSSFLELPSDIVAQVARDGELVDVDLRRVCFFDTETTGLSGGAGTMAFIVGLGFFVEDNFCVRQYFLRDPGDEPAMIEALTECLPEFEALASFNGRAFDAPIIENRFILARIPPPIAGMPHLDLLHPARRLWRYRLSSCALSVLEPEALGVFREQKDVSGGLIPYLYRDYLRTGDARYMQRVLYHNTVDILSMVTLATRLCQTFADPWAEAADERVGQLSGADFYGLGRWYEAEECRAEAERAYRTALRRHPEAPDVDWRLRALRDMGYLLKRADRRGEAFAYWQQLALEATGDVLPHIELAKYFEWHVEDLPLAARWVRVALNQVECWPAGMHREDAAANLRHRLARLKRKMKAA